MTDVEPFAHGHVARVTSLDGDPAALGGAVTVALCGHWDHGGACRWPHRTDSAPDGDAYVVTVRFAASTHEVAQVLVRIHHALEIGSLIGPDGRTTTWSLDR